MRQKSDSVFLLTLVDLLVQVIFLAIFLGAIYLSNANKNDLEIKKISDPKAKIIVEVGVLKVAELVNAMVKLVPIDRIMELVAILPEFKSLESLKAALRLAKAAKFDPKILDDQTKDLEKKIAMGYGLPPCVFGPDKTRNLFRLQAHDGYYLLTVLTPKAEELISKFKFNYRVGDKLSVDQFSFLAKTIATSETECRYSIIYEPYLDSLSSYKIVERYFSPRIPPGWSFPK
jgi:hypothetical protein